jgi:hypothetical protein
MFRFGIRHGADLKGWARGVDLLNMAAYTSSRVL